MKNIFISYRREDTEGFARGLFQSLEGAFGSDHVFMDVEAIGLGVDFVEAIDKSLASCGALLVLIGKDWVNCTDSAGRRRLDDPRDFVRMEVAKALEQDVRVIPVLVKGARMPAPEDLPESLRSVTRRQALELRHERWSQDVAHLASALEQMLGLTRLDRPAPSPPMPPPSASAQKIGPWDGHGARCCRRGCHPGRCRISADPQIARPTGCRQHRSRFTAGGRPGLLADAGEYFPIGEE